MGVGCTVATRIGLCFEARARENDENHTEYRWQSFGSGGRHLVPARDQCTSWQFHDGTDSVGGLWRHRCCGGHRLIAEGQPHAKRLRERKDTQQHRRIPISYPRSGTRTIDRNLDRVRVGHHRDNCMSVVTYTFAYVRPLSPRAKKEILNEFFSAADDVDWAPRYNVAPTQDVPVIRQDGTKPVRSMSLTRWGLIPWS
jgi:hypothetical protein